MNLERKYVDYFTRIERGRSLRYRGIQFLAGEYLNNVSRIAPPRIINKRRLRTMLAIVMPTPPLVFLARMVLSLEGDSS